MSLLITNIQAVGRLWLNGVVKPVMLSRGFSRAPNLFKVEQENSKTESGETQKTDEQNSPKDEVKETSYVNKDRSVKIPVETSIKYMQSEAYKITYGDKLIWKLYRRNFKGQFAPKKTRKTCVRAGVVTTGNPCPICRDEYLVLDYQNTKLLDQFISPHNGEVLSYQVTNICQRQHKHLLVSIQKAKNFGTIPYDPPHRTYNYSQWYKPESTKN